MNKIFNQGQRWISETEPDLGLGTVLKVEGRFVEIFFPVNSEARRYSIRNAPLRRVLFNIGDQIKTYTGETFTVKDISEKDGLITYFGDGVELLEVDLSNTLSFTSAEDRLFNNHFDNYQAFNIRYETLVNQAKVKKMKVRGLIGPRVSLIPHQLYIARKVSNYYFPRVLLADEVGLGKTIEAGLIIHKMLFTERVNRVLVLLPENLIHQWYVEMLRRFNLSFSIFDEERCLALETYGDDVNPFFDNQLVICSLDFALSSEKRFGQIAESEWDLLVVDEAHHLEWETKKSSKEYQLVELLSERTENLLLLSATPEQLGQEGHFSRLKLLDKNRFYDLKSFLSETKGYSKIANISSKLIKDKKLTEKDKIHLIDTLGDIDESLNLISEGNEEEKNKVIKMLVDQHGTGRVMYRNNRSVMENFPKRKLKSYEILENKISAKVDWLVSFLNENTNEKILLICKTKKLALDIEKKLKAKSTINMAVFHEGLSIIARDRNAAYFSENDGANLLICSEIGSEGRNFQFSHNLVLFDLPLNPDLLEQRIGRLDRIGQEEDIVIHVPYYKNTSEEILFEIYNQSLNAFKKQVKAGSNVLNKFKDEFNNIFENKSEYLGDNKENLTVLLADIKKYNDKLSKDIEKGRDLLLEFNSFRPEKGKKLVGKIEKIDSEEVLPEYMNKVFDHFGVNYEEITDYSLFVSPADNMFTDSFPYLKKDGLQVTYERQKALEREDIEFLTWEHPMVTGAIDLLLSSEQGNSAITTLKNQGKRELLLEAIYVVEAIAPKKLQVERFLPPTPIRTVINQFLENCNQKYPFDEIKDSLTDSSLDFIFDIPAVNKELLKVMLNKTKDFLEKKQNKIINKSLNRMLDKLTYETKRLISLQKVNPNIRDEEIEHAKDMIIQLNDSITSATVRLDSLRLIYCQ